MTPTTPPRLYVRPEHRSFSSEDELRRTLDDLTKHTLVEDVRSAADLELDAAGVARGGYRFTSAGLKQVCALAAAGLFLLVRDLAGVDRDPERPREEFDFERARRVYNRAIALRAPRFAEGHRLLKNARERLIEGVLGPRYTLVENSEILAMAAEAAAGRPGGPLRFREATLAGRRLQLRYVAEAALFSVAVPGGHRDRFRDGLHFANSEVGGESTFRAAALLHCSRGDAFALGPFLGGRRVHAGRRFREKLAAAFAAAAAVEPDAARLAAKARALTEAPLPLAAGPGYDDRIARLVARLREAGVPVMTAHRVVAAVAADAACRPATPACTQYDLFASLTCQGRTLYATAQEAVEQAAFALLDGRLKP